MHRTIGERAPVCDFFKWRKDRHRRSRGADRPSFQGVLPSSVEGAGNAGRSARPQPCVQNKKHTSVVTTVTPETPGIPRAMVLTVSFVLLCLPNLPECANGRFSPTARRWI